MIQFITRFLFFCARNKLSTLKIGSFEHTFAEHADHQFISWISGNKIFTKTISIEGNVLYAEAPELAKTPMTPLSATEFNVKAVQAKVIFPKNTTYTFVVESGKLIARHFRTGDVRMTPTGSDVFSCNRWYFGQVEFIRDGNKKITGCKVGGGRVRNLRFDKVMNASN